MPRNYEIRRSKQVVTHPLEFVEASLDLVADLVGLEVIGIGLICTSIPDHAWRGPS